MSSQPHDASACILSCSVLNAQLNKDIDPDGPGYAENCTSIMVGRLASADGSVMTSHTCDGRLPHLARGSAGKKPRKRCRASCLLGHPAYRGSMGYDQCNPQRRDT
ncbi:MAG: hypothetical protein MZV63_05650 [Marinilabiliales bacterium]|nr:hypothetical protein [Marinilabiliales bacterium]